ncbi:MAG TPA: sigma-70 family RNA polymerase sigma factor [Steroidobacteraceae bacterium]|nr:sigma-70 family RNA polymerase sigma factor [Steroidobacteraceae bacterium]
MTTSIEALREQIIGLLPRLRRFARALVRHPDDADDLVQITIERALTRLDQWRPDSRLESWMFGILRNAWIDEVRARGRRSRVLAPAELGENVAEPSSASHLELLVIENALAQLPEDQRVAVALVLIEGLSYKEAATILEVPIGTLTSRLARAREALALILEPAPGVAP